MVVDRLQTLEQDNDSFRRLNSQGQRQVEELKGGRHLTSQLTAFNIGLMSRPRFSDGPDEMSQKTNLISKLSMQPLDKLHVQATVFAGDIEMENGEKTAVGENGTRTNMGYLSAQLCCTKHSSLTDDGC